MSTVTATQMDSGFVAAAPGTWTRVDRAVANHEATHATAAVLLGLTVSELRIDHPSHGVYGHCATSLHAELWRNAGCSIAPAAFAGSAPPAPDISNADHDVSNASAYWRMSKRPAAEWPGFVSLVRDLLVLPSSRRAHTALAGELLRRGAIRGVDVHSIVREAEAQGKASTPIEYVLTSSGSAG